MESQVTILVEVAHQSNGEEHQLEDAANLRLTGDVTVTH